MPRPAKAIRLAWRAESRRPDGSLRNGGVWVIRDGGRVISTGCGADDRAGAESALAAHIAGRHDPRPRGGQGIAATPLADIVNLWLTDVAAHGRTPGDAAGRAIRLLSWWGDRTAAAVTGANCRAYALARGTAAGARRELQDLGAALNHWRAEGHALDVPRVTLPAKGGPRERWLTRDEAARLLRAAWRMTQDWKGRPSDRRTGRHVARFILIALYTGSRGGAVCAAGFAPSMSGGWIDLESGVFHRAATGERQTNKRKPPVPLPARLLAHLRRWHRLGIAVNAPVEWNGRRVTSIKKAFRAVRAAAGFGPDVTAHVLRHTTATWLMQAGVPVWEAAGFLGMSAETLNRVYGHHHPDHLKAARDALDGAGRARQNAARRKPDGNGRNKPEQRRIA